MTIGSFKKIIKRAFHFLLKHQVTASLRHERLSTFKQVVSKSYSMIRMFRGPTHVVCWKKLRAEAVSGQVANLQTPPKCCKSRWSSSRIHRLTRRPDQSPPSPRGWPSSIPSSYPSKSRLNAFWAFKWPFIGKKLTCLTKGPLLRENDTIIKQIALLIQSVSFLLPSTPLHFPTDFWFWSPREDKL